MPVIRLGTQDNDMEEDSMEEDEEEGDMEEEDEEAGAEAEEAVQVVDTAEKDDEQFMGHQLDSILESEGRANSAANDLAMPDAPDATAPSTFDTGAVPLPVPSPRELRSSMRAQAQSKESTKRVQLDAAPSSPSKRVKFDEASVTATLQVSDTPLQPVVVPQTSDFTVTSTASAVPELPEPGDAPVDGSDSDGDDVVSLVLGQDTDDESE
jgi:pre-rRNA-processing protein RIX1